MVTALIKCKSAFDVVTIPQLACGKIAGSTSGTSWIAAVNENCNDFNTTITNDSLRVGCKVNPEARIVTTPLLMWE